MPSNETITKEKIADLLKSQLGLSTLLCEEIISHVFLEILHLTKINKKTMLKNFGTFQINHKGTRPGFNIRTGDLVEIKPRNVLRFTPSRSFKYRINRDDIT